MKSNDSKPENILEIGTGSGAIAISIAVNMPECHIIATDICEKALAVAEKNRDIHECAERIELIQGDLFEPIKQVKPKKFNCIVSNPPYISIDESRKLSKDIYDHEPHIALIAGDDGLSVIRRLIIEAP